MNNLQAAWPALQHAEIAEAWSGTLDVTPDSNPVIGPVTRLSGLTLATGFRSWIWYFTCSRAVGGRSGNEPHADY